MSKEIVAKCLICQEYYTTQQKEPLLPPDIPGRPWQMVATHLFFWNNIRTLFLCWIITGNISRDSATGEHKEFQIYLKILIYYIKYIKKIPFKHV